MNPSSTSDKQMNVIGSRQSDYNATLPNNYRQHGAIPFPAGSGGSDGRRTANGMPPDEQQQLRSYTGSGRMNGTVSAVMRSQE